MSRRKFEPNRVCAFFSQPGGCKNGDKCTFYHSGPSKHPRMEEQSGDTWFTQIESYDSSPTVKDIIDVPTNCIKYVIGKGGNMIRGIKEEFGEQSITIEKDKATHTHTPITFVATQEAVKKLLMKIREVFKSNKEDYGFLDEKLKAYEDHPEVINIADDDNPNYHINGDHQSEHAAPAVPHAGFINQNGAESGWGPLIDQQEHMNINGENDVSDGYFANMLVQIPGLEPAAPEPTSTQNNILPEWSGFIPHSQHMVLRDFSPAMYAHKGGMVVKAQEIVTFLNFCSCAQNCNFGNFRNAVDMIGCVPMETISEDILKFECPYCDEINEFYEESEYLKHMCLVHFWRRLTSFLSNAAPFNCPLKTCNFVGKELKELILHYGSVPHRKVGALILDSVGERVKNMKIESLRNKSTNNADLVQEIEDSKRTLVEMQERIDYLSKQKHGAPGDHNHAEVERMKQELSEMHDLKKKCKKLENDCISLKAENVKLDENCKALKGKVEQEVKEKAKKIEAIKSLNINLKKSLDELKSCRVDLLKKDRIINSYKAGENKSGSSEDSSRLKDENASLKAQVQKLTKELNEKDKVNEDLSEKYEKMKTQQECIGGLGLSADAKDALIEKLKKTIKSQKTMISLKTQEIELIRGEIDNDDI